MTHLNTPNAWFQALTAYQPADGLLATPSRQESQLRVRLDNIGYTDLMVDGAPSPHQSDTTLRWLIDRLRS